MNRRWSERRDCVLGVSIHCDGSGVHDGEATNVGLGGMFIRTHAATEVAGWPLEVEVHTGGDDSALAHRFKAYVVHRAEDGLGIAFQDFALADLRALQRMF